MTPLLIVETIKAGFEFGIELLRFAQTAQGAALIQQAIDDRTKWDAFWANVGNGLQDFFTGKTLGLFPQTDQKAKAA